MVCHQRIGILAGGGAIACLLTLTEGTVAQIIPDNSLGAERSIVTPNVPNQGGSIDRIDGGAMRGSNLFHSFQDFNVGNLQRVYFANPSGIENILGRVTGNRVSEILGTLGVLGRANLFLINPNGIIFGKNARLDIPGSFFAGTTRSLVLENGYQFSTENPQAPPLLTINVRPGLENWLSPTGAIANSGNLSVGQNLTLVGNNLNLEGQLQAGGNLTLQASDILRVRDSLTNPFIASAGAQLLAQANKIDIFALNHPASGFFSGGNMVFRSANPIGGNAQFFAGGNFLLEQMNGNRGDLSSTDDPIIRASGDVNFNSYTGPSLHIFAGGSVNIDSIEITGPDTTNFINETVTLSDGVTTVSINGSVEPTVDIRAGTTAFSPTGITGDTTGFSVPPNTTGTPTSADITINSITTAGGLVFLTNQYQPNSSLSGNITVNFISTANDAGGGDVVIDSRNGITPQRIDTSGGNSANFTFNGKGGNITLLANGDIFMPFPSQIFSYGLGGGNITLKSQSAIIQEAPSGDSPGLSYIESAVYVSGTGGDVTLEAPTIFLSSYVQSNMLGDGQGGKLSVTANSLQGNQAIILNYTEGGDSGNVIINADSISLNQSQIGSQTFSATGGRAGDVEINTNTFVATGATPAVLSETQGAGDAGTITISTGSLSLLEGAQIRSSTQGLGNAGRIGIAARESITIDGGILLSVPNIPEPIPLPSSIVSEVLPGSEGQGSVIEITTSRLSVSNGGFISASTASTGNAGDILITATESASFDGNPGDPFVPSGAFVGTVIPPVDEFGGTADATGKGGTLRINTPSLSVTNGARLEAVTDTKGNAGNIIINASESVFLSGADTGLFSNTSSTSAGNGGNISVDSEQVEITNGAAISVDSQGTGTGGNIEIQANELTLDNQALISAETASTNGGNIALSLSNLLFLRRESQISTTAGTAGAGGDGGNITIDTEFIVTVPEENSDIKANAFLGRGGNVDITATSILGIQFREQPTPNNDITASSQFGISGTVTINNPEVDPASGLVELKAEVNDPSNQVVVGCAAARGNSFTITGRGGLPEDPTATITATREQTVWQDLQDFSSPSENVQTSGQKPQISRSQRPMQLVEATGWVMNEKGQVELVSRLPSGTVVRAGYQYPNCNDLQRIQPSAQKK